MPPTADELEAALRDHVASRGDVAFHEFCREHRIAASVVQKHFGSWGELRERLGLPRKKPAPPTGPSNEELLERLRELAADDPELRQVEFVARTGWSHFLIASRFGNWTKFRKAAGLPERTHDPRRTISDEELIEEVFRIERAVGQFPRMVHLDRHARYSISTYLRRLGRHRDLYHHLATRIVTKKAIEKLGPHHPDLQRTITENLQLLFTTYDAKKNRGKPPHASRRSQRTACAKPWRRRGTGMHGNTPATHGCPAARSHHASSSGDSAGKSCPVTSTHRNRVHSSCDSSFSG